MIKKNTVVSLGLAGLLFSLQPAIAQSVLMPVPNQGQTPEQMDSDMFTCSQQASAATGFYPNASSTMGSVPEENRGSSAVRKAARGAALGAVVGAIAGDAGKGAAVGAAAGGTSGLLGNKKGALSGAAVGAAAGAVAGDAGKGAAIGAGVGAVGGAINRGRERREDAANQQQQINYNNAVVNCMSQRGYRFPSW